MGFQRVAYTTLVANDRKAIEAVLLAHHVDSVKKLERRFEVELLLKTMEILKPKQQPPSVDKTLILNAMNFYIRHKIKSEYTKTDPNNSKLYNSLGVALNLTEISVGVQENNQPTLEDERILFKALLQFMMEKTYVNGNPDKGYLSLEEQPFLGVKKFNTTKVISDLVKIVADLELKSVAQCESNYQRELQTSTKPAGLLSSIGSMFTNNPVIEKAETPGLNF